jgi:hypothetical protein
MAAALAPGNARYQETLKKARAAAESGKPAAESAPRDAKAQYNLGVSYANGEGVVQDAEKAVYWYTKAAEQGYVQAQFNLGCCYYEGNGVVQDDERAAYWWTKAAEQGDADAQNNLAFCYGNAGGNDEGGVESGAAERDEPGGKKIIALMERGEIVTVLETGYSAQDNDGFWGNWLKVRYGSITGWCFSAYLDPID